MEVNATVTELSIETTMRTSSNPSVNYEPAVKFEYRYNGTQYTGTKVYPADIEQNYETQSAAESVIGEYKQGAETTAYVGLAEPNGAFLKRHRTLH